ncbi:sodium:alanine symporter family protein, partial [Salmonella enterica subsp. enterica serovar Typhimurium]|nr:sodium:alanine symporter family protein [Salmonella enterica subsp. enterica serovar Typhimurium]
GVAFKLAKDYNQQRKTGKLPQFDINLYPEIRKQVEDGIWEEVPEPLVEQKVN